MNLIGYTSTSKNIDCALDFAFENLKEDQLPVVFEIEFKGQFGLFEYTPEYTAFPQEEEVLVQDGLEYRILSKSIHETENNN